MGHSVPRVRPLCSSTFTGPPCAAVLGSFSFPKGILSWGHATITRSPVHGFGAWVSTAAANTWGPPPLQPRLRWSRQTQKGHSKVSGWGHPLISERPPHLFRSGCPSAPLDWHLGVSNCSHVCGCAVGYPRGFDPFSEAHRPPCHVGLCVRPHVQGVGSRLRPSLLIMLFIFPSLICGSSQAC